jgi:hypothetical protein
MKGCIILFGESFRLGGQGNRNTGSNESYHPQIEAANSHVNFIKDLNGKGISVDVYISSYKTKFTDDLVSVYKYFLIGSDFYDHLMGHENLINNAINKVSNIKTYDFLLIMRIDLYLKNKFTEIFNGNWDKILWPSICFKPHHKCGIHPRVNDMMIFIPKKYYSHLENFHRLTHEQWAHLVEHTSLEYDCLDTMIKTFHDSDSAKDFNPLYYIVNRHENNVQHTIGDLFDKWNF